MYVEVLSMVANDMLVDLEAALVIVLTDFDGDEIAV